MKSLFKLKCCYVVIGISIMATTCYSQSQTWNVGGNAVPQGQGTLGTTNCNDLNLTSNNRSRIKIPCNSAIRAGGGTQADDTAATRDRLVFGPDNVVGRLEVNGFPNSSLPSIYAKANYSLSSGIIGIRSYAQPVTGYGYAIQAEGGRRAVYAYNNAGTSTSSTYGTYSSSYGTAGTRVGIYGSATGSGGKRYGVYGYASGDTTLYGIYAGYFAGNVLVSGIFSNPSDRKLKEQINREKNVLTNLINLQPSQYYFKKDYLKKMNLSGLKQHGLIADEVEKLFPELVSDHVQPAQYEDQTGKLLSEEINFKGINYIGFVPLLIQSIKEQQEQIEQMKDENDKVKNENEILKSEIAIMKARMDKIENSLSQNSSNESLKISDLNQTKPERARLEQCNPNPFSVSTVIRYYLPDKTISAVINILSEDLKSIKSYSLNQKGNGTITIPAAGLKNGNYVYELIVDGVKADSKTMILTK